MVYAEKGDLDKAIADYTAAIEINPKAGYTFYARGYFYHQKGDKAKANADFAQAKKLGYKLKSRMSCALARLCGG